MAADDVPRHQPGQVCLLLRRGAEDDQRRSTLHICALSEKRSPLSWHPYPSASMTRVVVRTSLPAPPSSAGTGRPWIPNFGTRLPCVPRELARILAFRQILVEFPPGEGSRCLHQFALLGGQREVHCVSLSAILACPSAVAGTRHGLRRQGTEAEYAGAYQGGDERVHEPIAQAAEGRVVHRKRQGLSPAGTNGWAPGLFPQPAAVSRVSH